MESSLELPARRPRGTSQGVGLNPSEIPPQPLSEAQHFSEVPFNAHQDVPEALSEYHQDLSGVIPALPEDTLVEGAAENESNLARFEFVSCSAPGARLR